VIFKSDKLDYLGGPRKEIFVDNFFSIRQGPSNVGKLNWNLLGFFSFIFSIGQCGEGPLGQTRHHKKITYSEENIWLTV
jgi:hypothetical protein